jgi:histone H3/H4
MGDVLVVTSKVKEAIKAEGCNTASDAVEAISAKVNAMVKDAAERAKANGRKTVRGVDF